MAMRCCNILPLVSRLAVQTAPRRILNASEQLVRPMSGLGSGIEHGGGSGGSIRESGGGFGEREAALEEMYFRELTTRQLENLHEYHQEEIRHIERELKDSEETLKRHKEKLDHLKKMMKPVM